MTAAAISSLGIRVSKAVSRPQWPRQISTPSSISALTQPAIAEAVAMPAAPIFGNSVYATDTLTATEMAAKYIGVRVPSRAK